MVELTGETEEEFDLDEPLFTIAEVVEKLLVSDHTVRSWIPCWGDAVVS